MSLLKQSWIIIGVQQWTVEESTGKYVRLKLASWHKGHSYEIGQEVEIEEEPWIISAAFQRTIHLRPKR